MTHEILEFWFGTADPRGTPTPEAAQRWFGGGPAFDEAVRTRFGALLDAPDAVAAWASDAAGALAAVVTLDQFPRNVFRGSGRAFATDAAALALSRAAVAAGYDRAMGTSQRTFLYLPFEHSEHLADQDEAVRLFGALLDDVRGTEDEAAATGYLAYAERHRSVIRRFGRFPGRNLALGRTDTPEEAAWLAGGGETFGQR